MTIKEMRVAADVSQEQLAKLCGVTQSAVSQWENGESYPQAAKIPILSQALFASEKSVIEAVSEARERLLTEEAKPCRP